MTKGKSVVVAFVAVMCAGACLARPCGPGRHGGWHRPPPIHHGWHGGYHHHGGYWGRGGCHFWPGFVGGVVGGVVGTALTRPSYSETVVVQPATTVVTTPAVVQQPIVVQQPVVTQPMVVQRPSAVSAVAPAVPVQQTRNVWVEGRYVDQVQANGSTVRIWQPGHYEQLTVVVQ